MSCYQSASAVIFCGVIITLEVEVQTLAGIVPGKLTEIHNGGGTMVLLLTGGLESGGHPASVRFEKILATKDAVKKILILCDGEGVTITHKP